MTLGMTSCGTLQDSAEHPTQAPPDTTHRHPAGMTFETRTDTVATTVRHKKPEPGATTDRSVPIRFMVQIGAFKDPEAASKVQVLARERYRLPVLNDYHTTYALYQIRIGFFETRKAADLFRRRMQQEFPGDYKDAWVVQLKR